MSNETSMSGGPNLAVGTGSVGAVQSGPGASQRVTGREGDNTSRDSGQSEGRSVTGNQTGGEQSPSNGGLAKVFAGQSEAGEKRVTGREGDNTSRDSGQSDQSGQPKGNLGQNQSNDSLHFPTWTEQLQKKLTSDSESMAKLSSFKNLDEFVQAYLEAGDNFALPGEKSSPEEIQAFYERLGKPKEEASYSFAKSDPELAALAFGMNLSGAQADALYNASQKQLDDARKEVSAQTAKDFTSTDSLLRKEYGENYEEAIVLMRRGLGVNPKTGELSPVAKALYNAGLAGKPEIVRAFIELGRATSEGTASGGSSSGLSPARSVTEGRGFDYKDIY